MHIKIQICLLGLVLLRLMIFLASHYYCIKYDYVTPGVSLYQSYYYPLMSSLYALPASLCVVFFVFIVKSYRLTKIIALSLFFIDLITSVIILYGFNFQFYMEMIFMIYGITLAIIAIDFIKKGSIFLFLPLLVFSSCISSRDVQKKREAESSKTNLVDNSRIKKLELNNDSLALNVKRRQELLFNIKNQTFTLKEILEPIDNTKPSSYRGGNGELVELNNTKKTTEKTYNNNESSTSVKEHTGIKVNKGSASSKSQDIKKDIVSESENKKKGEEIQSHRTTVNLWWLVPLIIVILLVVFFKNKAKIISFFKKV
jgi:hypothetical protein